MSLNPCTEAFVTQFFNDFSTLNPVDKQKAIDETIASLEKSKATFLAEKPTESISSVVGQFYTCASTQVKQVAEESAKVIFTSLAIAVIATMIIALFVVASFYLISGWMAAVVIIFLLVIYAIVIYFTTTRAIDALDEALLDRERGIQSCLSTAESQLEAIEAQTVKAFTDAVCTY